MYCIYSSNQCRERWMDHLDPSIDHTEFDEEEDGIILDGQLELGNSWKVNKL
jgi:hypothetical protein